MAYRPPLRRDYPEPPQVEGAQWIQLGGGRFALVDESDFPDLCGFTWKLSVRGGYAVRNVKEGDRYRVVKMHRQILGEGVGDHTDHRNGNKLDNRRENLRDASALQNGQSKRAHQVPKRSKYRGVRYHKKTGAWNARIQADGKRHDLGYFASEKEAARAFDDAARRLHGAFACVNFPRPGERSALDG